MPNRTKPDGRSLDHIVAAAKSGPVHNFKRPDMSWRDHLVMLLTSGAEIEHALMVQYLYAAYSIDGEQASPARRAMVEGWRASILSVAREEMGHLLTVQNVLVLLGAPINLSREMLPWDHEFYPFPFSLEPLSKETLQRFIYAEMPIPSSLGTAAPGKQRQKLVPPDIDEQTAIISEITAALAGRYDQKRVAKDMHRVGELYAEIIDLIEDPERIPDSEFNEATYDMQASWDDWGRGYKPPPHSLDPEGGLDPNNDPAAIEPAPAWRDVLANRAAHVQIERAATRAQAVAALRALAAQGEAPHLKQHETGEPSHFDRFVQIYQDLGACDPPWPPPAVLPNPTTRNDFAKFKPSPSTIVTYISTDDDEVAAHYFAQLFNQRYRLLLTYLAHTFRLARTQPIHQPGLRGMVMHRVFGEMYNLKAIASLLVRLPVHGGRASPPFEMPYSLDLPQADGDIWRLYDDLLVNTHHTCSEVFRIAKLIPIMNGQITRVGGDVYLRTLINIDDETRRWIGKILAGGRVHERAER